MFFIIIIVPIFCEPGPRLRQSCQTGLTGYYWDGQLCLECKKKACTCTSYKGCSGCIENYYFDTLQRTCIRCPIGCTKCCQLSQYTQYICTECQEGYLTVNGVCVLLNGCLNFSQFGRCTACQSGYYLGVDNTCQVCKTGCFQCTSESQCFVCASGYYLVGVECKPCSVSNCRNCDVTTGQTCQSCLDTFHLVSNSCIACIANCRVCSNSITCDDCLDSYINSKDKSKCLNCQISFINCLTCDEQLTNCLVCQNGYYLDQNKCLNCQANDPNVRRCDDLDNISQCKPGYNLLTQLYNKQEIHHLLRYLCVENVNDCRTLVDVNGNCVSCLQGSSIYNNNKTVVCVDCGVAIPQCDDCLSDATTNFTYVYCLQCASYYYINTNYTCSQCSSHCNTCTQKGCSICDDNYYLSGNNCVQCLANCKTCNSTTFCSNCADGYGWIDSKCLSCQQGCVTCDYNRAKCTQCDTSHYYLYNSGCIPYNSNCQRANSDGFCYLCQTITNYDDTNYTFTDDESVVNGTNTSIASLFYRSINGYCLLCSDYSSGTFNCPDTCTPSIGLLLIFQIMFITLI